MNQLIERIDATVGEKNISVVHILTVTCVYVKEMYRRERFPRTSLHLNPDNNDINLHLNSDGSDD